MAHDLIEADTVSPSLYLGSEEWKIIETEVVLSTKDTADYAMMIITPSDSVDFPSRPGVPISEGGYLGKRFVLNVDTDLRANTGGPEVRRIFTGQVANMNPRGDYSYQAIAYDPSQQPLESGKGFMTQVVNSRTDDPDLIRQNTTGYYGEARKPGERRIKISTALTLILDEAGITDRNINLREGGIIVGRTSGGKPLRRGYDTEITFSVEGKTVDDILDRLTDAANATWWFDRFGTFNFGPRLPNEDIFAYELRYITDASDGKTSPQWNSVQVIGDGVVSEEGWVASSLQKDRHINSSALVAGEGDADLVEPVFTYRNLEINTQDEADNVRTQIAEELRSQKAEGEVTVVGFPEVRPGDAVKMPSTDLQPMGGERYGVREVRHRLNPNDGFLTKISVQGLTNEQSVVYADELNVGNIGDPNWSESGGVITPARFEAGGSLVESSSDDEGYVSEDTIDR